MRCGAIYARYKERGNENPRPGSTNRFCGFERRSGSEGGPAGVRAEGPNNPSLSAMIRSRFVLVLCCLVMVSCGQQKSEQIEWQLPLSAPSDPHGAKVEQDLPGWAAEQTGHASLMLLQKSTARITPVELDMGGESEMGNIHLNLLGLANGLRLQAGSYIDDENVHNPAAFVEVSLAGKMIYRGWLYQEFPELFGPDMADWKLWLKSINIQSPVEDTSIPIETGTRP